MKSKILAIASVIALVGIMVPATAFAAESGTSQGSFTLDNVAPIVDTVTLYDTQATPATTTSMTPQVQYDVRVGVTEANTIDDLSSLTVTIYYDTDGTYNTADRPGSGDAQKAAILTWTNLATDTWEISAGATTTWLIGSCVPPSMTAESGIFQFKFTPGMVATETVDPAEWHIYAVADDGALTDDGYQEGLSMNWYGAVTVSTTTVAFGNPVVGDWLGTRNKVGSISVKYVSNGSYDVTVSSGDWASVPAGSTATYDDLGICSVANQFSLKADTTGTFGSPVQVTKEGAPLDTGTQTLEDAAGGNTVTTNALWLKRASAFTQANYQGNITFTIGNAP